MKIISRLIFAFITFAGYPDSGYSQAISGTASALLITPITIVKNVDMNFGNIAVSSVNSGTVILTPAGSRTTGGAGGVTLPAITGTISAADFTVSGQGSYTYTVSLPVSVTISNGSSSMTINTFTSSPSSTGIISPGGTQDLTVGATLNVSAGQTSGAYTNASAVPVTVNYN